MTKQTTQHRVRTIGIAGMAVAAGLSLGMFADSAFAGNNGTGGGTGTGKGNSPTAGQQQRGRGGSSTTNRAGGGAGQGSTVAVVPASATLTDVLTRAVAEERLAVATYDMVIDTFGEVVPFTNIVESEARHVASLERLADRYGVDVSNVVVITPSTPATLQDAYQLGVDVEIEDGALYDELEAALATAGETADYPDVLRVFDNLQAASLDHHLPTFQSYLS